MKSRNLIIGLIILVVLIGVAIWDTKRSSQEEERKQSEEKVLHFDPDKVQQVAFFSKDGEMVLEKDVTMKKWKLVKPVEAPADDDTMNSVVTTLSGEKYEQVASEGDTDPKIYGLADSKMGIRLTLADGSSEQVMLGKDSPLPGKLYLQRKGDKRVLFASSTFRTQVEKTMRDVRDKHIFNLDHGQVTEIEITNNRANDHSKTHLKKGDKGWVLEGVVNEKADDDAITGYLNALDSIRAMDFVSERVSDPKEKKRLGLDKAEVQAAFYNKDKKTLLKFFVGPKKDNFAFIALEGKPTAYQVYASVMDQVFRKPDDFRDRRGPLEFKRADVEQIFVKMGLATIELVKKEKGWESVKPLKKDQMVSEIQVQALLDRLEAMRVGSFLGVQKGKGLNPPHGEVSLKSGKGELLLDLIWGEKVPGAQAREKHEYYAKTNKGKETYGIDQVAIDNLPVQTLITSKTNPQASPSIPGLNTQIKVPGSHEDHEDGSEDEAH